jgi:hypothetical protein
LKSNQTKHLHPPLFDDREESFNKATTTMSSPAPAWNASPAPYRAPLARTLDGWRAVAVAARLGAAAAASGLVAPPR